MSTAIAKYDPFAPGGHPWARSMIILLRMRAEWALSAAFSRPSGYDGKATPEFEERTRQARIADALLVEDMKGSRGA